MKRSVLGKRKWLNSLDRNPERRQPDKCLPLSIHVENQHGASLETFAPVRRGHTDIRTESTPAEYLQNTLEQEHQPQADHQGNSADEISLQHLPTTCNSFQKGMDNIGPVEDSCVRKFPSQKDVITSINKSLYYIFNWSKMLSFISITGAVHFTAAQYDFMAQAVRTSSDCGTKLITYKTVRTSQWEFMINNCFPSTDVYYIPSNTNIPNRRPTTVMVKTANNSGQDARDCVRIIKPSEWAKLDVITLPIYKYLFESNNTNVSHLSIENAPLVRNADRRQYLCGRSTLWAFYDGTILPSSKNDLIQFECHGVNVLDKIRFQENGWISDSRDHSCIGNHSCTISGKVGPIWCVRSMNSLTVANYDAKFMNQLSPDDLLLFLCSSLATHSPQDFCPDKRRKINSKTPRYRLLFLFPGDTCTAIRSMEENTQLLCIMVASFIWREDGRVGERLLWIDRTYLLDLFTDYVMSNSQLSELIALQSLEGDHSLDIVESFRTVANANLFLSSFKDNGRMKSIDLVAWAPVSNLPSFPDGYVPPSSYDKETQSNNSGTLENGTLYVIYRFILYTDGFKQKKSLSDQRSVCGCYIMPAGLPHHCRCSSTSGRIIALAAHGQNTNSVLDLIVDDIVEGSIQGIDGFNPYGERVKIFLDAIAIIGDYPAVTSAGDLSGHTSNSFCSFCVISRRKGTSSAEISYSSKLHSKRPSMMRFDERMKILRSENINATLRKHLGTSCDTEEEATSLISIKIANALNEKRYSNGLNGNGAPVMDVFFDSYQSGAAVPDHLFKGLISNVLTVCFNSLPNNSARREVDKNICKCINEHKLPSVDTVLSWDKRGGYNGLNNLKTSSLFCVILFAAQIFNDIARTHRFQRSDLTNTEDVANAVNNSVTPYHLPKLLQDIICIVYWWPSDTTDLPEDVSIVRGDLGYKPLKYFGEIQKLSCTYVDAINLYYECGGRHSNVLDKPNVHRLLELAYHTIPMYGHALNVSELVLEQVHRNFKEWLEKNSNDDAHITAVEIALGRDWANRIHALYKTWKHGSSRSREVSQIGLTYLMCGANALNTSVIPPIKRSEIQRTFTERIEESFRPPVLEYIVKSTKSSFLHNECERWMAYGSYNNMEDDIFGICYEEGLLALKPFLQLTVQRQIEIQLRPFLMAKFEKKEEFSQFRPTNSFNFIRRGDFVSARTDDNTAAIIIPSMNCTTKHYFVVLGISGSANAGTWLFVKKLQLNDSGTYTYNCSDIVRCLQLNSYVRKVAKIHVCNDRCGLRFQGNSEEMHHDSIECWHVLGSKQGFPPHMG